MICVDMNENGVRDERESVEMAWRRVGLLGQIVDFEVGYARLRAASESGIVAVCFGLDGGPALLGATSLQVLSLAVHPIGERLVPAVGYMLTL